MRVPTLLTALPILIQSACAPLHNVEPQNPASDTELTVGDLKRVTDLEARQKEVEACMADLVLKTTELKAQNLTEEELGAAGIRHIDDARAYWDAASGGFSVPFEESEINMEVARLYAEYPQGPIGLPNPNFIVTGYPSSTIKDATGGPEEGIQATGFHVGGSEKVNMLGLTTQAFTSERGSETNAEMWLFLPKGVDPEILTAGYNFAYTFDPESDGDKQYRTEPGRSHRRYTLGDGSHNTDTLLDPRNPNARTFMEEDSKTILHGCENAGRQIDRALGR